MKRTKMTIITILTAALMMTWAIPLVAAEMDKIDINSATKEQLMTLEGIGEAYAVRIVEFRKENGPFQSPADLLKVKGIGERTYEMNKDRIVVKEQ